MLETQSTCPYCGVGCGVIIESRGTDITGVRCERSCVLFRAAARESADDATLARMETIFGLDGAQIVRYADGKKGQGRTLRLARTA